MPFDPLGSRLIQNLNFVVYQSADATLAAGQGGGIGGDSGQLAGQGANFDEDNGTPWVDDTSTSNGWSTQLGPGVGHTGPEANNGNNPGSPGGPGTPGPTRPTTPPGMVRRVPPGGSGVTHTRRQPAPVIRVTITADDELKLRNTVFSWDGDEFTDAGLQ